jgi:glycosyltransferase involved in cell wall biosynthesis
MKILHLCINCPYTDNWGYQDNLIPKYHKRMGHNVTVITTNTKHADTGEIVSIPCDDYFSDDGVRIIRLQRSKLMNARISQIFVYYKIYDLLTKIEPEFIMIHGLGSISVLQVAKYIKKVNKDCIVVADNHSDTNNTKMNGGLKFRLYKLAIQLINKYMQKYYKKVYGVTLECKLIISTFFGINRSKTDFLPLGCDLEMVDFNNRSEIRNEIRKKYSINGDDFLIVTGGKLDDKKETHNLMKSILNLSNKNVKLIVFGNAITDRYNNILKDIESSSNGRIKLIGFLQVKQIYDLYFAADLAVFPGSQSVLWQQAICLGLPLVVKRWPLIEYLDLGGNIVFLDKTDEFEIKNCIETLLRDEETLEKMKEVAMKDGIDFFSYEKIARSVLNLS